MILLDRQTNENARAYAYRVLLFNILIFEFKPGDSISEKDIAASLAISRTPIREALMELVKNGLVSIIPQKGSYISKIDFNIIQESRFLRLTVELAILRIACEGIPDEYIIELKKNIMNQELSINTENVSILIDLDNQFHKLLFEATGKQWTYGIVNAQMVYFDRYRYLIQKTLKRDDILSDHKNILNAVIKHDFDTARHIISEHLGQKPYEKDYIVKMYPDYFTDN